jgi:hypothetical protein
MDVPRQVPESTTQARRPAPIAAEPVIAVPPDVLQRYNARVLDPAQAAKVAGQPLVRSTVYLADKLLVSGAASDDTRGLLAKVAAGKGLALVPPPGRVGLRERLLAVARNLGLASAPPSFADVYELQPAPGQAVVPDAWEVLQAFRVAAGQNNLPAHQVGLDHLLTATKHIEWTPYNPPGLSGGAQVSASYGMPGWGGRQPVAWVGAEPNRKADLGRRRPVVAILDSGVGVHDWFPASCVQRNVSVGGVPVGLAEPSPYETGGVVTDPLEGVLDPYSGHGTFIAGLVRQRCPDADILSVRVMPSDGASPEHVILHALTALAARQMAAQKSGPPTDVIDVVSLSLGYYPEHLDATVAHPFLFDAIEALGRSGVVVVASAGNDATSRPMYPAAFAPHPGGLVTAPNPGCAPVISVGALNPDGTVALFSNAGDWVLSTETGAGVVSTFPKFDAAGHAAYAFEDAGSVRSTIDPDNFASGFGIWSGTSFAAPVLAGKIAQSLADGSCGSTEALDPKSMLDRAWNAVAAHTKLRRQP